MRLQQGKAGLHLRISKARTRRSLVPTTSRCAAADIVYALPGSGTCATFTTQMHIDGAQSDFPTCGGKVTPDFALALLP